MKNLYERIEKWVTVNKARFFILSGVIAAIIILLLDYRNGTDWEGIQVEAHGMLFDVILFGIILSFYEHYMDKKREREQLEIDKKREREEARKDKEQRIQRYREEIFDYLGWQAEEAKFRILGNIKRLNKEGVTNINLSRAYLKGAELIRLDFQGANLTRAFLEVAMFYKVNLKGANLEKAYLEKAYLEATDLHRAILEGAFLREAFLWDSNLTGADLRKANLEKTKFQGAKLERADLRGANLKGAKFKEANLENAIAYESQREDLVKAGADISDMVFV